MVIMCAKYTDKKRPRSLPVLHTQNTQGYLSEEVVDLRHKMTMAAPEIVFKVYGIPIPIKFNPKIKIAPASAINDKIKITMARIENISSMGFPFTFSNILRSDFIFYL